MGCNDEQVPTIGLTQGDITKLEVDAIVNAANGRLIPGGGVDGAIHRAGGPSIATEAGRIVADLGQLQPGEAVVTAAGDLPCRFVIHTVGPTWAAHTEAEAIELLAACYANSLGRAEEHRCRSVGFPNISTGVYGFPRELAARTAVSAVAAWLTSEPDTVEEITFVCFEDENVRIYKELLGF